MSDFAILDNMNGPSLRNYAAKLAAKKTRTPKEERLLAEIKRRLGHS